MRKISTAIFALTVLLLTGCNNAKEDDAIARNCIAERTPIDRFSFCLPTGWNLTSKIYGDVGSIVIFVHAEEGSGTTVMQVYVKKDPLKEPVTDNLAFAERAVEIARQTAPNYVPISTEPITVNDKETILHIFDASPKEANSEIVRYYQFVVINNGIAYGFTAIMDTDGNENMQDALEDVFTNVRFL